MKSCESVRINITFVRCGSKVINKKWVRFRIAVISRPSERERESRAITAKSDRTISQANQPTTITITAAAAVA